MNKKVNLFLFIIGILISIFNGVFNFSDNIIEINILILILLGAFIGLLNINAAEEAGFLLSSLVYIFSVFFITPYMYDINILLPVSNVLINLAILTAGATTVVSLRWIFSFTSSIKKEETIDVFDEQQEKQEISNFHRVWAIVMVIAIAVVLIEVILESFFDILRYESIINVVDIIVLVIFVIDLVVIYMETKRFGKFIKTAWIDIIATIPFNLMMAGSGYLPFRFLKLVRIIKLQKTTKLLRINRVLKFFSHKSKFNEHIHDKK